MKVRLRLTGGLRSGQTIVPNCLYRHGPLGHLSCFRIDDAGILRHHAGRQARQFFFELFGLASHAIELFPMFAIFFLAIVSLFAFTLVFFGALASGLFVNQLALLVLARELLTSKALLVSLVAFDRFAGG